MPPNVVVFFLRRFAEPSGSRGRLLGVVDGSDVEVFASSESRVTLRGCVDSALDSDGRVGESDIHVLCRMQRKLRCR